VIAVHAKLQAHHQSTLGSTIHLSRPVDQQRPRCANARRSDLLQTQSHPALSVRLAICCWL